MLRCSHCGNTQLAAGECESCHDAEVRYFCPNHTPGRWLDDSLCEGCGATTERGPLVPVSVPPLRPPLPRRTPPTSSPVVGTGGAGGAGWWEPEKPKEAVPAPEPLLLPPVRVSTPARSSHAIPEHEAFGEYEEVILGKRRGFGRPLRLLVAAVLVAAVGIAVAWVVTGGTAFDWIADVSQSAGAMLGTPAQTQRGIDAYRRGDRATAERELNEASRSYRRSAIALLYLAQMRVEAGDMTGAGPFLDEAITREPDNPAVRRMAGEYHLTFAQQLATSPADTDEASSHLELAEDHLSYVVSKDPSDRRARGFLACVLTALGRNNEARAALTAAGSGPWDRCARPSSGALVPSPSPM